MGGRPFTPSFLASLLLLLSCPMSYPAPKQTNFFLYVGTYGKGIYGYRYDTQTGNAEALGLVAEITNPSFLATSPNDHYLYAVSELDGNVNGGVAAYAINPSSAALRPLNSESSDGQAPCHISVDHSGKIVLAANYGTGQVPVFPVGNDGKLDPLRQSLTATGSSVNKERQSGPHAHEAVWSPDNHFVYVPDLGLDQIRIYKFDASAGKLSPAEPAYAKLHPGNGPRHIAISADGKFAYVINELNPVVTVFSRDPKSGALTQKQEIYVVENGYTGESGPAEIIIHPAGKFLYASNRGPGTIAVFAISPGTGTLTEVQIVKTGGTWPRGVAVDPAGHFLLVGDQKTDKFVVFHIDANSGKLSASGKSFDVPSPVSFAFVPVQQ
jgi:6-phosphogluconolactonase